MELRNKVGWYEAKRRRRTIEATTACSQVPGVPGMIIFFCEGQEGHAWMMIPGSAERWLRPMMNCINRGSHEKSRKVRLRYERLRWPRVCFFLFFSNYGFFLLLSSSSFRGRSDLVVFGRGQNLQSFPLLRKVPLTSAVSEID